MAEVELDHVGGGMKRGKLRLLSHTHLLDEVSEQESIFTHPLHRLQQVGRQVHLITQLHLLPLGGQRALSRGLWKHWKGCSVFSEAGKLW